MKTLLCLAAAALLCGCGKQTAEINRLQKQVDEQQMQLAALSNSIAAEQSQIINVLSNAQSGLSQAMLMDSKYEKERLYIITNLDRLILKEFAPSYDTIYRQQLHGKIDPATGLRWSITNAPGTMNPETGLPW
jgi:hypothetical protein